MWLQKCCSEKLKNVDLSSAALQEGTVKGKLDVLCLLGDLVVLFNSC